MKKIFLIFAIMLILFGCEEKSKIELVPDIDKEYLSMNLVETKAKWKGDIELLPFQKIIEKIHKAENANEDVLYPIYLRFYINEYGKLDKIKILEHNLDVITRGRQTPKYEEKIYTDIEKIVKQALPEMEKYEFTPAQTNGKKVKMRADVKLIYRGNKNGEVGPDEAKMKLEHIGSDFDKSVQGIFFVAVEEMPSPIGGIKAIQDNIVYPEIAQRAGIEGRVYVKAYVDSTGKVVKTEIMRGIGGGCDEAAEDAVKKVEFIPGKQRGKRMNVQVTVPILFKLNDNEESNKSKQSELEDRMIVKKVKNVNQNGLAGFTGKVISRKTGEPIAATNVTFLGTKFGAATNNKGEFFISKIPPGEYKIIVNNLTYGKHYLGKVQLSANQNKFVEIKIKRNENLYQ